MTYNTPFGTVQPNTCYLVNFYKSSGNPNGNTYPSFSVNPLPLGTYSYSIPLDPNVDLHLINSRNIVNTVGTVTVPYNNTGSAFRIRDVGGYLSTTQLNITQNSNTFIESNSIVTLATNNISKYYCNVGSNYVSL